MFSSSNRAGNRSYSYGPRSLPKVHLARELWPRFARSTTVEEPAGTRYAIRSRIRCFLSCSYSKLTCIRAVEEAPSKDKHYRKYASGVERALSLFETALQEWADYISFLNRLLKVCAAAAPGT